MSAPYLIMGAHGGVGESLARLLATAGKSVVLTARDVAEVDGLAADLNAPAIACDAMDPASIQAAVAQADAGEGLAGLAYCIGSIDLMPLRAATASAFVDSFKLNAVGAALSVQAAQRSLAKNEGAVVLFSSVAASQGFANHAVIAAAKGAVEGLTVSLAAELAPKVRVNAIAPSLTRTKLADTLLSSEAMAKAIAGLHPLQRLGEPQDLAALAAFLLGPQSGWITGQIIGVDGGRSALASKG